MSRRAEVLAAISWEQCAASAPNIRNCLIVPIRHARNVSLNHAVRNTERFAFMTCSAPSFHLFSLNRITPARNE